MTPLATFVALALVLVLAVTVAVVVLWRRDTAPTAPVAPFELDDEAFPATGECFVCGADFRRWGRRWVRMSAGMGGRFPACFRCAEIMAGLSSSADETRKD